MVILLIRLPLLTADKIGMSHDLASKLAERLWCIAEERIWVDPPSECAAPLLVRISGRPVVRPWKLDRTCIVIAGFV